MRPADAASLPAGASAFLHIREGAVVGRALSAEARAAGVVVDTFADVLREPPGAARRDPGGRAHPPRR